MSIAEFHRWSGVGVLAIVGAIAAMVALGCQSPRAGEAVPDAAPSQPAAATSDDASHAHEAAKPATAGAEASARRLESMGGGYVVEYRTEPATIPLNELFSIRATVTHAAGGPVDESITLTPDARMPHHRHGMNTKPVVARLGPGEFLIEGMMFHMPGRWEIYFDMTRDGETERAMDVVEME